MYSGRTISMSESIDKINEFLDDFEYLLNDVAYFAKAVDSSCRESYESCKSAIAAHCAAVQQADISCPLTEPVDTDASLKHVQDVVNSSLANCSKKLDNIMFTTDQLQSMIAKRTGGTTYTVSVAWLTAAAKEAERLAKCAQNVVTITWHPDGKALKKEIILAYDSCDWKPITPGVTMRRKYHDKTVYNEFTWSDDDGSYTFSTPVGPVMITRVIDCVAHLANGMFLTKGATWNAKPKKQD